jgi:hypothetical protein
MPRRSFTVEEANAMIPQLESAMREMEEARALLQEMEGKLHILTTLWGESVKQPDCPDHEEYNVHIRNLDDTATVLNRLVREEIVEQGLRFPQGGLEFGLIDFPTTYHGRWVYLCWRRGEPRVVYWHEIDAGFGGRVALTPRQESEMGLKDDPALLDDSMLDF